MKTYQLTVWTRNRLEHSIQITTDHAPSTITAEILAIGIAAETVNPTGWMYVAADQIEAFFLTEIETEQPTVDDSHLIDLRGDR